MHPEKHPEVVARRLSARQIKDDFCDFFGGREGGSPRHTGTTTTNPSGVTLEGFREYYRDVGVCEPYDAVFIPTVEALWGVREPRSEGDKRNHLAQTLRPKLLQHSRTAETPAEIFKKTLQYYSQPSRAGLHHGGVIGASGVERAFNSFGLYPDKNDIQDVFSALGSSTAELHPVDSVVAILCPPEAPMTTMFS
ncbi:unnamed protein product [Ascophyllum nodosum]